MIYKLSMTVKVKYLKIS
uniref:Uncharacterized protein n=1 Tax=Anguilla anguilla TaxID=7936 RepID=A0A0E9SEJ9_ANGAN